MAGLPPDNSSPSLQLELYGVWGCPDPPVHYDALIDTGFTGTISIPIMQALPLGLTLFSTANFTLADGSIDNAFLCIGYAKFLGIEKAVVFALSKGKDILVGTEFLAEFGMLCEFDYKKMTFSLTPQIESDTAS
jgi:predicted aspartyl protease